MVTSLDDTAYNVQFSYVYKHIRTIVKVQNKLCT